MRVVLLKNEELNHTPKIGEFIRIGLCCPIRVIFNKKITIGITKNVDGFKKMSRSNKLISWL